jgi:hypothetical protein
VRDVSARRILQGGGLAALVCASAGCGRGAQIEALRDAIARDDAVAIVRDAPRCGGAGAGEGAPGGCLAEIAASFGAKTGFRVDPPDQASAATAALILVRDGHGEWMAAPDAWFSSLRTGKGTGVDALRLAMAQRIGESAGALPHPVATDDDARALMRAVASSVPGACEVYALAGGGAELAGGPPERTLDGSPCVRKDLERPAGPPEHGKDGTGLWRGAVGALTLWREAARALREGLPSADADVRGALETKVGALEAVVRKVDLTPMVVVAPAYDVVPDDPRAARGDAGAARTSPSPRPPAGAPPPSLKPAR